MRDCVTGILVGLVEAGALVIGAKEVGAVVGDFMRTGALVLGTWVGSIVSASLLGDCVGAVVIGALVGTVVRDCVIGAFVGIVGVLVGALVTGTMVTGLGVDVATVGGLVRLGPFVVGAEVGAIVRACLLGG